MPLASFDDLKSAVGTWMARGDVAGNAEDFIALGEAGLNRELNPVEIDATLAGAAGSRTIDISSQSMVEPLALFLAQIGEDEIELTRKQAGTFPFLDLTGKPALWSINGSNIEFDRELDAAYPFRFRFRQRFALSASATTNWLLTNHPDLYLAATLIWGGVFTQDDPTAARWVSIMNTALPSVRHIIAQSNRSTLNVDPALSRIGRRHVFTNDMIA